MDEFDGSHAVVLGGGGFLGSHACDRLVDAGARVTVVDNFITGDPDNLAHLLGREGFRLIHYDVTDYLHVPGRVDHILHFASPASPIDYLRWPIQTLKVGSLGTHKALGLARAKGARFLLASTSEVYGDPTVNPQPETYWGNVNPVGPRGVYDEAKRFAEAITLAYHREHALDVRIARIFNTFGPRMRTADGRAVPEFFLAALRGEPLPVHGDGSQTRSLCYVDDLIDGLLGLHASGETGPMNLGNPHEVTMTELAEAVQDAAGVHPGIVHRPRPVDDPTVRRPDTTYAETALGWTARVGLTEGLARTVGWFRATLDRD
ncbi:NAD-dependent epimerase/dehydratase family protein [Egibacter rhizosphaerae]|uniref:NAD-dependent epimerase/dehydratase family protein n=1 Tax=Egibacter rhizosphaerae TaxID=1670831 RepID=A0A411YHJ8_9ACTN|nr:NAD-dependent epimerase/dehydratase family protein [Egibacter rhizosphaerae]QBI20591.1 NAD-dependent epimerase/dehydratase family protein [Egibacter rhizosphaerae]